MSMHEADIRVEHDLANGPSGSGRISEYQPPKKSRPMICTLKTFTMVIDGKIIA